ncbi:MAG: transglutaminase family protein [Planctomycetaceae bacterium]|nr:transglutaminase family protein [Planctomycetaceae bacterium]
MMYRVRHSTTYSYDDTVPVCQNEAHLKPRNASAQKCLSNQLHISPQPATLVERFDYFGNHVAYFTIQEGHRKLAITAESVVTVTEVASPSVEESGPWENTTALLRTYHDGMHLDVKHFCFASPFIPLLDSLADYARVSFTPGRRQLEAALDLTQRIYTEFRFDPQATVINTPPDEVLRKKRGVCQDFAHLMIGCLRSIGLSARYVSGYLLTNPPPGKPRLVGADVSHAWVSIYFPEFGWLDFDPTNGVIPSGRHITIGWGRDYGDVCPIKGVFIGGGRHAMNVTVDVEPV